MIRRALIVLGLCGSVAYAQPVVPSWRPPSGCTSGQAIVFNGSIWTCGSAGVTNSAGNNVIPKSDGTNLVASSWTDDGTNTTTTTNIIGTNAAFGSSSTTTAKVYSVVTGSGTGLRADNTSSGKTSDSYGVRSVQTGSFDSTADIRRNYGVSAQAAASRSAGSNDVINFGVYATASGGQVNYSLYGDAGTVALNVSSGNTCIGATSCSSKLSVTGNTSISGNATIGGTLAISTASGTAPTMTWTQSGFTSWTMYQPSSNHGLRIENSSNGTALTLSTTGVTVSRDLAVSGNTTLGNAGTDTITVVGLSTFNAAADFDSTVNVDGDLTVNGGATIGSSVVNQIWLRGSISRNVHYFRADTDLSCSSAACTLTDYSGDERGRIVCTDATAAGSCTVSFANAFTDNPPACILQLESSVEGPTPTISAISTSSFTFEFQDSGSQTVTYHCDGMIGEQ